MGLSGRLTAQAISWIVLKGLEHSSNQANVLQIQKVTIRHLPWRLEPYAKLRIPGLQQAIHNRARQSWERPTHASGTIEVRLQGRRTLTETHTQRKAYLTEGLQ
jgi:hypothetical protein